MSGSLERLKMKEKSTAIVLEQLNRITNKEESSSYFKNNSTIFTEKSFSEYFNEYLAAHQDLKLSSIIKESCISKTYGYEIANGKKKASRDHIIALCYSSNMTNAEIDHALTFSGNSKLYAKNNRDAKIIVANNLKHNGNSEFSNITKLNLYLASEGLEELKI